MIEVELQTRLVQLEYNLLKFVYLLENTVTIRKNVDNVDNILSYFHKRKGNELED